MTEEGNMLKSLKLLSYFYIVTLPFTFIVIDFMDHYLGSPFETTIILNIFTALSAFTYFRKIRPMVINNETQQSSMDSIKTLLWISIIITVLFSLHKLAGNVASIENDISQINQDVSNMQDKIQTTDY